MDEAEVSNRIVFEYEDNQRKRRLKQAEKKRQKLIDERMAEDDNWGQ
jgi:hypothetical protein